MRKAIFVAAVMALFSGTAFADGTEKAASHAPPSPLKAPHVQTHDGLPTIHYYGETVHGTSVATQGCGSSSQHAVTCNGSYVVVGTVLHSETMPAYVETVAPVMVETGAWHEPLTAAPAAPHAPKVHSCHGEHFCEHRAHKVVEKTQEQTVTLGDGFTGGVGYNIPAAYHTSRAVIVTTSSGGRSYSGGTRRIVSRSSRSTGCGGCCR